MNCQVPDQPIESKPRTRKRKDRNPCPLLIVLSGPSGVGKDAVIARMKKLGRPFYYVVTATTRTKRAGEKDGVDYHFLSTEEFQKMIEKKQFLEWANVYNNYYGVPKNEITVALSKELDAIVRVDVQGAASIKGILPQAVFIFLMPPSVEELDKRLRRRRSESSTDLALRLENAKGEIKRLPLFDYVITSRQNKLDEVVSEIDAIVIAEKHRVAPRIVKV